MKYAIYVRVSTVDQSTDMQLTDLLGYVKARGFELGEVYADVGISGAKERRPGLDKLMADARKRRFDGVLVWRFDRFARSSSHLATALNEFKNLGIQFISFQENVDTSSPMGAAMFTIISAIAQLERDIIRSRVQSGVDAAIAKGVKFGRKATIDKGKVKELNKQGLSLGKIAKELNCSKAAIARILKT